MHVAMVGTQVFHVVCVSRQPAATDLTEKLGDSASVLVGCTEFQFDPGIDGSAHKPTLVQNTHYMVAQLYRDGKQLLALGTPLQ